MSTLGFLETSVLGLSDMRVWFFPKSWFGNQELYTNEKVYKSRPWFVFKFNIYLLIKLVAFNSVESQSEQHTKLNTILIIYATLGSTKISKD